jgi:tetratricopeptide (TPR) repeat protein
MKNDRERAVREFESAVAEYPGYADAWLSLGKLRRDQERPEQARMALLKATTADPKLVSPFIELGLLASEEHNWTDTLSYLDHATRLDPANYPIAWFTMAVAGYNLKKYDNAEANARRAVRLDPKHGIPRAHYVLALILEQKQDYAGAAVEFSSFLKYDPITPDEPQVRAEIRRIEKMQGEASQAAK